MHDRFSVGFSEDMAAAAVNDAANFDLRAAGADGAFGTADDVVYAVAGSGYTSGLTASYRIVDGPLQPGSYRLTVGTGLTDRGGTPLASPFVHTFAVADVPGFLLESRSNDTQATATPLGQAPDGPATPDGSFVARGTTAAGGNNPWHLAAADLDGDGKPDLVVANSGSATVGVLMGTGDGAFRAAVTYAVGATPVGVAVGDLDGDGRLDLVVANATPGTVSVLRGLGDGTFAARVDYAAGSTPYRPALADLDGDGDLDLAVPNNLGSGTLSVLRNNGDGTFAARVAYAVGNSPYQAIAADLDGDGDLDLAAAELRQQHPQRPEEPRRRHLRRQGRPRHRQPAGLRRRRRPRRRRPDRPRRRQPQQQHRQRLPQHRRRHLRRQGRPRRPAGRARTSSWRPTSTATAAPSC